ncbi:hypothetical protein KDW_45100 [Dictyobacter vulcani]|uniref:Glycosyltransferase RgtA/B/C/D-like domain-containing protein n=1 Tax=Dictyobacter vulcani TaxID=2607529 RepID=A0A5J4KKN7_9CHLR|nr:hypothetical protein [Dictyobacter vulcani]GER90348.1 hypothetical protein KDW_45100 [Dictyobacter vulcani]
MGKQSRSTIHLNTPANERTFESLLQTDQAITLKLLGSWRAILLIVFVALFYLACFFLTHFVHLPFTFEKAHHSSLVASSFYITPLGTTQIYSGAHFIYLANAWLAGHLYVASPPPGMSGDYTFWHGHWYVAFPPLPALFFLPLVAIFHFSHQFALSVSVELFFSLLNVGLMFLLLYRMVEKGVVQLSFSSLAWLFIFFACGTELFYVSMQATVWFLAHVIATTFLLLHVLELIGKRRAWLAAVWLGLAALSRSTVLLVFPCYLLLVFLSEPKKSWQLLKPYVVFCGILGIFVGGMLLYNLARFGSLLDFGYQSMNVSPRVAPGLAEYGQFNLHFLPTNFFYMLIQPPQILTMLPYIRFDPTGTGIFWTMPALYPLFRTFFVRSHSYLTWSLLAGCLLPIGAHLLYFNTGWYQFGYRFFLDVLPLAFLLAVLGFHQRLQWYEKAVIILSIGLNIWGWFEYIYFSP